MDKCQIDLTDEEISKLKKEAFKKIVNESIQKLSADYLTKLMDKHTKSENLCQSDSMQEYLVNLNTTVTEKKLLFLHSRMFPVKMNFQQKYSDLLCSLCSKSEELQQHLLVCDDIVNEEDLKQCLVKQNISYSDIFGPPSKQTVAIKVWSIVESIWKKKLKAEEAKE